MKIARSTVSVIAACGALGALFIFANAAQPVKIDFADDTVGAEPKSFLSVVGVWRIEAEGDNKVLAVDGRQWKEGQTSTGMADKARALYDDRYAEFLDRVQAYAYFPYIVPIPSAQHLVFIAAIAFTRHDEPDDGRYRNPHPARTSLPGAGCLGQRSHAHLRAL